MQNTIYVRDGIVVKFEQEDRAGGLGCVFRSFELRDGAIYHTNYADHLCPNDVFDVPCNPSQVPEDISALLGNPLPEPVPVKHAVKTTIYSR